ncbi:acyltransferase family protein [Streptomyces sp. NPDC003487]
MPVAKAAQPPRLALVDGLRLAAALFVAAFHFLGTTNPAILGESPKEFSYLVHRAALYGWLGVEMFFLISGYVICMSAWGRSPGQFAVSRISRLFPAYWFVILLIVARIAIIPMQTGDIYSVIHPRVVLRISPCSPGRSRSACSTASPGLWTSKLASTSSWPSS